MANSKTVDFVLLNKAALDRCPDVLERLLPNGRLEGNEFTCGNLSGESGKSCKINIQTGKWSDFSTGESGGDIISLVAAMTKVNQYQAAITLAEMIGYTLPDRYQKPKMKPMPILPVPAEKAATLPTLKHFRHGYPTETYAYRDEDGRLLGYTCRFNKQEVNSVGKQEKVFAPFIYTTTNWRWQGFPNPYPFYGLEKLANLQPDGLVIVVEGEGKANRLQEVIGTAIAVLAIHGGSSKTKNMNYKPLHGRRLLYWPDKDAPGYKAAIEFAKKAQSLAESLKIIMPPEDAKETWDCANAIEDGWDKDKITAWIEANQFDTEEFAKLVNLEQTAKSNKPVTERLIPDEFNLKQEGPEAGLYWTQYLPGGMSKETRLGDPLHILGYTRTSEGDNWGLLLAWKDKDEREHQYALPYALISGQRSEWLPLLVDMGWRCNSAYKKQIASYLEKSTPLKRIRCVTSTGWSDDRYVLPDCIYGEGEDSIVLQAQGYTDLYQSKGSLKEWQELAGLCVGNPKLGFAVSCAFAGPLLELADMEGGLFSFEGGSSCGKTTTLRAAASVWGRPKFHVKSWRATDNSLEVTACLHNDGLLILDELGEASPKKLGETVYMLSGGQGKARAAKDGGLRKSYRWRVIALSSGELGLADKLLEDGKRARAGQDTRFVAIPVTTADIANLHGMANSGLLVRQVKKLADTHYGVAGREFLKRLTEGETLHNAKNALQNGLETIADSFCPDGCDGQVRRVALRFALVSMAGTLARVLEILPRDFEAEKYAKTCFMEWLEQRGGIGPAEDMAILNQVQLFLEQHGQSRFQNINEPDATCLNRAGYREEATFFCLPQAFKAEIVKGYSPKRAVEVLAEAGWLQRDGGRNTRLKRIPNLGPVRVYMLKIPGIEGNV